MEIPATPWIFELLPEPHRSSAAKEGAELLALVVSEARAAVPESGPIDYQLLFLSIRHAVRGAPRASRLCLAAGC
jgi:hypothetical protein